MHLYNLILLFFFLAFSALGRLMECCGFLVQKSATHGTNLISTLLCKTGSTARFYSFVGNGTKIKISFALLSKAKYSTFAIIRCNYTNRRVNIKKLGALWHSLLHAMICSFSEKKLPGPITVENGQSHANWKVFSGKVSFWLGSLRRTDEEQKASMMGNVI